MREPWLDVLKGAAMALVVANHTVIWPMRAGDETSAFLYGVAYGTVAAFAAATGYIAGMRPPAEDTLPAIRHRAFQLLLPWAFWAVIYALGPVVWGLVAGTSPASLPSHFLPGPWALALALGGGPLWFLPVIFVASFAGIVLDRRTRKWWPAWVMLAAYVAIAAVAWAAGRSPLALGRGTFWAVAPLYVASYWIGLRIARDGVRRWMVAGSLPTLVVTALVAGFVTLVRAKTGESELMWLAYGIGAPGGWAALVLSAHAPRSTASGLGRPLVRLLERAGVASRGIYVLHPLIVGPMMLAGSLVVPAASGLLAVAVLVAVLGVWLSVLLSERLRRLPHGHALV